ncbi:MFS transporter [Aldersonia kunmingensis]|uniref:MFS transporter n=1 Tax=Aldersonia kunmingensis TaxID=408066 RepID=UPI001FE0E12F|nr:MFS transporter [Aldersonia kunmingensis]
MRERTEMTPQTIGASRRWSMLALGVLGQSASALFVNGTPFLIPALRDEGLSLTEAGVIVAMPTLGLVLTLIAWGWVVDRIGERKVLVSGLGLLCAAAAAASFTGPYILLGTFLLLGGMAAASTNGASGRVIVGWFPPHRRGLAMGIRQTAQPLGVGLGAITLPSVASAYSISAALLVPAVMAGLAAVGCLLGIIDPPRPDTAHASKTGLLANPYRKDATLWRIHGVSVLLVIPQMTVWTFALVWLHDDYGWSLPAAGALVTAAQLLGAGGRIGAGALSDAVGSRMRPLRWIATAAVVTMAALAATSWVGWWIAIPLLVIASVITVSDNGLAFTAIAEIAGPYWSGRGLGVQNTGQNLAGAAIPPLFGLLITTTGFSAAFLVAAAIACVAIPLVPHDPESQY